MAQRSQPKRRPQASPALLAATERCSGWPARPRRSTSRSLTIMPIAPHLSFSNAVVFEPEQELDLEVQDEPAVLSLDGQEEHELKRADRVIVKRAEAVARFARTAHARPFVELLREKIL